MTKDFVRKFGEKVQQRKSREFSELTGTRGRKAHKGKASSSNKHTGGKLAR